MKLPLLPMVLLAAALSACQGPPTASTEYRAHLRPPARLGRIVVYRSTNGRMGGSGRVTVDAQSATLQSDRFVQFDVPPGRRQLKIGWHFGTTLPPQELTVNIRAGELKYVAVETTNPPLDYLSFAGGIPIVHTGADECHMFEVSPQQAQRELMKTEYAPAH